MSGIAPVLRETELQTRQRQLLGLGTLLLQQAQAGQWDAVRLTDGRLHNLSLKLAGIPNSGLRCNQQEIKPEFCIDRHCNSASRRPKFVNRSGSSFRRFAKV